MTFSHVFSSSKEEMLRLLIILSIVAVAAFRGRVMTSKTFALFDKSKEKSAVPSCYLQATDPFFSHLSDEEENKMCTGSCPVDDEISSPKETTVMLIYCNVIRTYRYCDLSKDFS